ncbi:uncharacterized protein EV422DRAFT_523476 [Fimicolochytrium jonesii]|uniref:uncharacterized protein n=1 Tax=Fimicolochytrium jonesii TaxID=1396493 RepID=UPI0022FDBADE|nr:uncharacterized protein EV422DRAFT_523476 [Fimicolochytrium jonesii]KAI8823123.1 hypothetical protein EV422DRAFT_523476 [Fimicolochytrium jonesii]
MLGLRNIAVFVLAAVSAVSAAPVATRENTVEVELEKRLSLPIFPWEIPGAQAVGVKKMIVFGDSLSDNGNTAKFMDANGANPPFPRDVYPEGRYTNGLVWSDYISQTLKASVDNYAYGGSTTSAANEPGADTNGYIDYRLPGLIEQVNQFASAGQPFDASTTLFSVWSGANDYWSKNANVSLFTPKVVVGNIVASVNTLIKSGAKNIVVFNLPPGQSQIPWVQHNLILAGELIKLAVLNPSVKLVAISMEIEFAYIVLNRKKWGFKMPIGDVLKTCVSRVNPTAPRVACPNPADFLLYDSHPTTKTHQVIADRVLKQLVNHNIVPAAN